MMSESLRIPSKDKIMFSLFLPPKIASAVQLYGDVTIFDASASFLSIPSHGMLKKREPNTLDDTWIQFKVKQIMPEKLQTWKPPLFNRCAVKYEILLCCRRQQSCYARPQNCTCARGAPEGLLGTEKSVVKLFFLHSYRQGRKRTVCGCKDDSLNVKQNCRRLQGLWRIV